MDGRGEELRRRVVEVWDAAGGAHRRRYPQELRLDVGAWVATRRGEGARVEELSAFLGLSAERLGRWTVESGSQAQQACARRIPEPEEDESPLEDGELLPVRVSAAKRWPDAGVLSEHKGGGGLVLVTPGGYRVSGLDLEGAAALLGRVP